MNEPYRILLVEDHTPTAKVVTGMLEMDGFATVVRKSKLRDAIVMLGKQRFDIVLLDLNLEDSRGIPTMAGMMQNVSGLPVIALTGSVSKDAEKSVLELGASGFMNKPIGFEKLQILKAMIADRVAEAHRHVEEQKKHRHEIEKAMVDLSANSDAVRSQADIARDQLASITNGSARDEDSTTLRRRNNNAK